MFYRLIPLVFLVIFTGCLNSDPKIGQDLSAQLEDLGIPNLKKYNKVPQIYARNVWDLQSYDGRLFIGAGNSSNLGPARNAGPVPVIAYNPTDGVFTQEFEVNDEQIDLFYVFNDDLFIPGHDPRESWKWGNIYRRNDSGKWRKARNVPGAIHVYAMHQFKGILFAGLGAIHAVPAYKKHQGAGSAVSISRDNGVSWINSNTGGFRIHAFLEAGETLLATDVITGPEFKKYTDKLKRTELYAPAYEFDGQKAFKRRKDITPSILFPGIKLPQFSQAKIVKPVKWKGGSVYIGALCHNDHQFFPFGLFYADDLKWGQVNIKKLNVPDNFRIWDMLVKDKFLYLLGQSTAPGSKEVRVFFTENLKDWQTLLYFKSPTFARSFEFLNEDLYFGLGCELLNPKEWSQKQLHPKTGTILRLKKEFFR